MGLFKHRTPAPQPLGPLEVTVMEILWARGESNVRDVVDRLDRPCLHNGDDHARPAVQEGLLARRKCDRAFLYSPSLNRTEWEHKRAGDLWWDSSPSRSLPAIC